jgi:hypothetical protein
MALLLDKARCCGQTPLQVCPQRDSCARKLAIATDRQDYGEKAERISFHACLCPIAKGIYPYKLEVSK